MNEPKGGDKNGISKGTGNREGTLISRTSTVTSAHKPGHINRRSGSKRLNEGLELDVPRIRKVESPGVIVIDAKTKD